jgi:choline dehydrogenase-like flavoprotein
MIDDARTLPEGASLDADLLIIGAGAAGISMALDFVDTPVRVIVLESGGLTYERATQRLYDGVNVGLRYEPLDLSRVRMFGGSTSRRGWAGWCKLLAPLDFERRPWVGLSGWPIARKDLDPYYQRALRTVWLPASIESLAEIDARSPDCLALQGENCCNEPIPLSTAPHLAESWGGRLKAAGNVRVLLHANVLEILTDGQARVATGARVSTLEGKTFNVTSAQTVLAAGGIETARLLLLSDRAMAPGLGNASGWVGRCFMDHPRYAWGQIARADAPHLLTRYNPTHGVGQRLMGVPPPGAPPLFGAGIAVSEAAQRREGILASRTWILPVAPQGERSSGRELREIVLWLTRRRIPSDIALRAGKVLRDLPNAASAVLAHLGSIAGLVRRWHFVSILEPEPNPDSRVTLDASRDQLGLRRVRLDWRLTPLVGHSLARAQQLIVRDLSSLGVACAVEGEGGPAANQSVDEPRWVWHHMGTTRMSADPSEGVVDGNCLVHGMSNLFIAGSSVFPTVGNDMPTLTVVALAHRLADHLKMRFGLKPLVQAEVEPKPAAA